MLFPTRLLLIAAAAQAGSEILCLCALLVLSRSPLGQLAQDAAALGPAAAATAAVTCLAVAALYSAMHKAPTGAAHKSFNGGNLYAALVRVSAIQRYAML